MNWLDIALPFAGQLFQERGDALQKSRDRTVALTEDRYKRNLDVGQETEKTLREQMLKDNSPATQQSIAESKAQEGEAIARTGKVGAETTAQQQQNDYNAKHPELMGTDARYKESLIKDSEARRTKPTPSEQHLETEKAWVAAMVSVTDPAKYQDLYNSALSAGLDDQTKSTGYSAPFASWVKTTYNRWKTAQLKDGGMQAVDAGGGLPTIEQFQSNQAMGNANPELRAPEAEQAFYANPFPEVGAPAGPEPPPAPSPAPVRLNGGPRPAAAQPAAGSGTNTARFYGISEEELQYAQQIADQQGVTVDFAVRQLKRKAGIR